MAFSQSGIADVRVVADGADLFVAWTSTAPSGSTFQVYLDRRLAWHGTARRCHLPIPAVGLGRNVWVEVGTVAASEATTDYSASLSAPGGRSERALLTWAGGTYLDPTGRDDVRGFWVYQGASAGAPIDPLSAPVATVVAYPGGWINDGFGKNGFGEAGFGRAATSYEWESGPLGPGTWNFAVVPIDSAGNARGVGLAASVVINSAPRPPAPDSDGSRLTSTYSGPIDRQLTLNWLPSPSAPSR